MGKKYAFGVDIGGTSVKIGLFDTDGVILEKWEIPTNTAENGKAILPDIAAAIEAKLAERKIAKSEVAGIGMGVPGPVDSRGNVLCCANLGWGTFNVEEALSGIIGLPVRAGNDANVAALGEMWKGGGEGYQSIVMVTLGTGVGSGIIVDGKILAGANGAGGEVGHMMVNKDETETCGCGNKGCLEQYASATGIARLARQRLAQSEVDTVLRQSSQPTAKDVLDAAKAGDAVALELLEEVGEILGVALSRIATVCNPEIFVIGGGVSKAGSILTDVITKYYKKYAFHALEETPVVLATLGNDAGMYGGVKMVLS
jgi:glucokinase